MDQQEGHEVNLGQVLGADEGFSIQVLTLYIPNKDKDGNELGDQRQWVSEAADLLAKIGGGVTILPPCEGGWLNRETKKVIWESPVLVYTYVEYEKLMEKMPELRNLLHRLGRETKQGDVAFEFDGYFYCISKFDE